MTRYRSQADWTWKQTGSGAVLLNLASGAVYPLNNSAAFLWQALMDGQSETEIIAAIKEKFAVGPIDIDSEIRDQIARLRQTGLIEPR